jgi:hypothetical protein
MNTINFKLRDGLPMNQDVLDRLQSAFSIFNAFGNILGDKTIVSGCELVGSTVSDGVVYLNGQVYPFKGGLQQTKVILNTPTSNLIFKDNNSYPVINTPYISFGTGVGAIDWADFKAGFPTKNIDALVARITALEARPLVGNIPIDLIALWGRPANEIPPLWVEYTGLAGRVPMGFKDSDTDFDVVGKVGGTKGHTLTIAEMPEHDHAIGNSRRNTGGGSGGDENHPASFSGTRAHITDKQGGGQAFSILNPYRVVHYIQYKGV